MTYLLLALVFFFLALNVFFRVKIIKKYKALSNKQINLDSKMIFDRNNFDEYVHSNYPDHAEEIKEFKTSLNRLIIIGITGFVSIVIVYLLIRFL